MLAFRFTVMLLYENTQHHTHYSYGYSRHVYGCTAHTERCGHTSIMRYGTWYMIRYRTWGLTRVKKDGLDWDELRSEYCTAGRVMSYTLYRTVCQGVHTVQGKKGNSSRYLYRAQEHTANTVHSENQATREVYWYKLCATTVSYSIYAHTVILQYRTRVVS